MNTAILGIIGYIGLRVAEVALKEATKNLKEKVKAKKYAKVVSIAKIAVNDVIATLNRLGTTSELDKIKHEALEEVAVRTGLPYAELDEFVDLALDEVKGAINDVLKEDNTVTVTDTTTNTTATQQPPIQ